MDASVNLVAVGAVFIFLSLVISATLGKKIYDGSGVWVIALFAIIGCEFLAIGGVAFALNN